MKFTTLLIIFIVIVLLDKGLTIVNILEANKHFPEAMKGDYYKIEQNPIAKWFFNYFGLWWGSFFYGIISIITLYVAYIILNYMITSFGVSVETANRISLWIIFIYYGFVIANNSYFLLKYSEVIT